MAFPYTHKKRQNIPQKFKLFMHMLLKFERELVKMLDYRVISLKKVCILKVLI